MGSHGPWHCNVNRNEIWQTEGNNCTMGATPTQQHRLPPHGLRVLPLTLTMTMRSVNKFYAGAICIGINIFVGIRVAFVPVDVAFVVVIVAALVPRHYVNLWHLNVRAT